MAAKWSGGKDMGNPPYNAANDSHPAAVGDSTAMRAGTGAVILSNRRGEL